MGPEERWGDVFGKGENIKQKKSSGSRLKIRNIVYSRFF